MQLYIIRHAQSENNLLWQQTGSSDGRLPDPALTEKGHEQARLVAQFLAQPASDVPAPERDNRDGFSLTHLYCSLMERAVLTGTYIAQATGLPLKGLVEIHEWGGIYHKDETNGERIGLPGPDRDYFAANHPHLVLPESLNHAGWWNRDPELPEERPLRARRFWQFLLKEHGGTDDRVAIVSHGGFTQTLLATLLNRDDPDITLGLPANVWFATNNASVSRIDFESDHFRIGYLNRVDFLPDELIT
ncbi:MAG: histidine phosphatase family protein [Ardenticatenaceae bacterium]|nr:histidine phosphatase family protein [Ardenticatenaceae bacterium]